MFSMNESNDEKKSSIRTGSDRSRYFNPSKNYWFSFNAFLGSGSPIRRGFAPSFVNYKKGALDRLEVKFFWSDKNGVIGSKLSFK
jgi:hypothetical protein